MTYAEIEEVGRVNIDVRATVGELRAALQDPRIPDAADIVDVFAGCSDIPLEDYSPEDLINGHTPTEHVQVVNLTIEWEL